jgi:hypothetical protein
MRFSICLLTIFINITSQLYAQVATVKGLVRDEGTGKAIYGAEIFIRGIPSSTQSERAGNFLLNNVPFGVVEIQVRKEGYQKITLKANIQSFNNGLDITLSKNKSLDIPESSSRLNKYREKVVLVTDKPYYYPGEIIWLKAFLNCATFTFKDSLSRVAYVDLIDSKNNLFRHLTLSLDSGNLQGQIVLPEEVKPGNYMLVAYTNFMRNFGEDDFYYQVIPVLSVNQRILESNQNVLGGAIGITTNKLQYKLREKISISLTGLEEGDYSISVIDAKQVVDVPQVGFAEAWDFSVNTKEESALSDYVMEKGVQFIGQFTNEMHTGKKVKLSLYRNDYFELINVETNHQGWFEVNGLKFYDSSRYLVTAYPVNSKKVVSLPGSIKLLEQPKRAPSLNMPGYWFVVVDTDQPQRFLADYLSPADSKLLDTITVADKRLNDAQKKLPGIIGGADVILQGKDLAVYDNLPRGITGKVPGLLVSCLGGASKCRVNFNRQFSNKGFVEPLVLVDNIPRIGQPAGNVLLEINPQTVERIEFRRRLSPSYGLQAVGGIIAVYLKKSLDESSEQSMFLNLNGFSRPQNFVSPDYSNSQQDNSVADYRSTLYWNPSLSKGVNGEYSCYFFASDLPGKYRILVRGVTRKNKPVNLSSYIEVK